MLPRIGWIGCGVMGTSMVKNLLSAGYPVGVFTRTRSRASELLEAGCHWFEGPAQLARESDVVISMVGYPSDVEEVYLGEAGVYSAVAEDGGCRMIIDMTTSTPSLAVTLAEKAQTASIMALDAPVSGGDIGARDGTLSIMVGGSEQAFDEASPIFDVMGKQAILQGGAGAGQHTKMVNQTIIASTMIGVCEGRVYARRSGLDRERVLESVGGGAAGSWSLSNLAPRILEGDLGPGFFVEHFVKDMGIALQECDRMGISLPGLELARRLYQQVVDDGGARLGTQALYRAIDKISGHTDGAG